LFDVLKVSSISLSAEYIKEKQWSDFEQQSWQDMTAVPGILISEMAQDFQVCSLYVYFTVCSNRYWYGYEYGNVLKRNFNSTFTYCKV